MSWSRVLSVVALGLALAVVHETANAQRDSAASRDQFNSELGAIVQLLESNQYQLALARAVEFRSSARRQFGAFSLAYLKSLDLLAECQRGIGALKDTGDTLKEALAIQIRNSGQDTPDAVRREFELADLLAGNGDLQASVQLYKTALPILERRLGVSHPTIARFRHDFALVLHKSGDDAAADEIMRRSLDAFDKGGSQYLLVVSRVKTDLAVICLSTNKLDEAESLLLSALEILDDPRQEIVGQVEKSLIALAEVYRRTNREEAARKSEERARVVAPNHQAESAAKLEALLRGLANLTMSPSAIPTAESVAILTEQLYGPRRYQTGIALNDLGQMYSEVGRYTEAEANLKRAVDVFDRIPDRDSYRGWGSNMATSLNNLGLLYTYTSRYDEALPLLERAHLLDLAFSGENSSDAAASINNIGLVYLRTGRLREAEQAFRDALETDERISGPASRLVGIRLMNLAAALAGAGKYDEAMPLMQRARTNLAKRAGENYIGVASIDGQIAGLFAELGKLKEAETLYSRAIRSVDEFRRQDGQKLVSTLGVDNTQMSLFKGFGRVFAKEANWQEAVRNLGSAVTLAVGQVEAQASSLQRINSGQIANRDTRIQPTFEEFVSAAAQLRREDPSRNSELAGRTFEAAQWARASVTAGSLAEMAMRGLGRGEFKATIRELQDLIVEKGLISAYMDSVVGNSAFGRDADKERRLSIRAGEIDARILAIRSSLKEELPKVASLMEFSPVSVQELQEHQLSDDEALILFLDAPDTGVRPEETFIWVITKTSVVWANSDLGTSALAREVAALRCGVDYDGAWVVLRSRCPELLKVEHTRADEDAGKPLPFDLGRAHSLYKSLFGQVEESIKNKRLLIVPSGALTQLPFQALVTATPKLGIPVASADYRDVAWFARKYAVTLLPAVSSLKALRQFAKDSVAPERFIGFGNPLLLGDPHDAGDAAAATEAQEKQRCVEVNNRHKSPRRGHRSVVYDKSGAVDLAEIRSQVPLPSTADELCAIAKDLDVDPATQVFLGAQATEAQVKRLSDRNDLQKYRIVDFATHGAVAGDFSNASEPGLILTPPREATDLDDGYLSASEISSLKFDADWVILSACNTSAGVAPGTEALSGLARSFFYAGARSLLVSNWAVDSDATAKLVTKAVAELNSHPEYGRAEALRRSMLDMIDSGSADEAHPAIWAPFMLVGEGSSLTSRTNIKAR
ncbi:MULTISPECIES: CHAT domain-containing protein [unclassified Bradyrhizobium]|uniref:CHAT domain-containing protein n=1 Tax=unclassified Bradyrhizobium TaxID=2631580 RepID=UPI001FF7FC5F|nr:MULTISPECIES: CHAT domain-containing protein [unclassified Bradyrhizobium]MCK1267242.1 CHAT domain-containing protein [Bradyrhizobium sp. 84]MCK1374371.1 CHAT domain-containing protein [Bradyrhizobium sp. 49]MCK1428996.1 CHAT domain-containing protein [Bradyrhizobium sp. 87]